MALYGAGIRVHSDNEDSDSEYNTIWEAFLEGLPCKVRMKHMPAGQLKKLIKVDLVVASPGVDIRTIIDDFVLDICSTYYDGQCFLIPCPISAFAGTTYYQ